MWRYLSIIFWAAMAALFAARVDAAEGGKISVVATIFPQYDWTRVIVGDTGAADVTLLMDRGIDLHSYQPTADDMVKISTCDLFIYVGGESDEWVEEALKNAANKEMKVVKLLEALGDRAKLEEMVPGMEAEEDHDDDDEEGEFDEHVWLSLENAEILVGAIAGALSELAPAHAEDFGANAEAYRAKLAALDARFRAAVESSARKTVLFCDRFPFHYLADDLGLTYYAAFAGCSAETEASFETIAFLAGKVKELELPAVLTIEGSTHHIAETVASASGMDPRILTIDSMQSVSAKDVADGTTYIGIMEHDLEVLTAALN